VTAALQVVLGGYAAGYAHLTDSPWVVRRKILCDTHLRDAVNAALASAELATVCEAAPRAFVAADSDNLCMEETCMKETFVRADEVDPTQDCRALYNRATLVCVFSL
jgi:hypothetical protein